MRELGVVNIGVTRYALPLGPTELKKMEHLGRLASLHVVGFSSSLRYQRASEPVEFYLLPFVPSPRSGSSYLLSHRRCLGFVSSTVGKCSSS